MTFQRRATLGVDLTLNDNLSPDIAAAKSNLQGMDEQVSKTQSSIGGFAEKIDSARPKIRELGRAGSELAFIADTIGGSFGATAGPLGDFIHLGGQAGLVITTVADVGPQAVQSLKTVGASALATAGSLDVLTASANASKLALLGIGGLVGLAVGGFVAFESVANSEAAKTNETLNKQKFAASEAGHGLGLLGDAASIAAQQEREVGAAAADAGGHVDESTHHFDNFRDSLLGIAGILKENPQYFHQFTDDLKDTGAGLDNVDRAARAVRDSINSIPTSKTIELTLNINGKQGVGTAADLAGDVLGSAAGLAGPVSGGGGLAGDLASARAQREAAAAEAARKAEEARRKAQQAADEAARKAQQEAERLAQIYKDKVAHEFDNAKKIADTLFDSLHNKHIRAINDAEKLAQANHDAAVQAIQDNLNAQLRANAAPVTAAEQAQARLENQRSERNLVEALQAAQQNLANLPRNATPADIQAAQRGVRDAAEALQSFQADQKIATLKAEQDRKDAQAQADAAEATRKADADLAAAQRQQIIDLAKEDKADRQRRADFEKALVALEAKDRGKPIATIDADIAALEKKFGIFTDPITGAHHIGDAVALAVGNAIRNVKVEPKISVVTNPHFVIEINGQAQPASTVTVRTAQQRPRTQ